MLSVADRARLEAMLGMLGSDHENEIVTAGRAIAKMAKGKGKSPFELVQMLTPVNGSAPAPAGYATPEYPKYDRDRFFNERQDRKGGTRKKRDGSVTQAEADFLREHVVDHNMLKPGERESVMDVIGLLMTGQPVPPMQAALVQMLMRRVQRALREDAG